jgi:hypothetical protein
MSAAITSITSLQNLTNLQNFYADWNSLTTVNLSGLSNLVQVDISDNEVPGTSDSSLTSVTLTGCTALEQLRLDDSDFSAGIPDLSSLTSLQFFDMDQCGISGAIDISASSFNNLTGFDLSGNTGITSITLPEANLDDVNINGAALTETAVNDTLQWLDGSGVENGSVNLSGGTNAIPTGAGATSKTNLQGKGWTVNVNQAPPGYVGIAASTDFNIVGDFAIEMFVNMNDNSNFPRPYSIGVYPAANAISLESGTIYFWGDNSNLLSGTFNPTLGEWYDLCVTGVGDSLYILIDGVQIATGAYDGAISSQSLPVTIGYGNEPGSGFNGLISNFRWTDAYVYDPAGFTVPTSPLTDLADTKLLIFQGTNLSAQLTDNSGNANNATNSGATYSALNPFTGVQGSLQMGNV